MNSKVTIPKYEERYNDFKLFEEKLFMALLDLIAETEPSIKRIDTIARTLYEIKSKRDNLFDYFIADNKEEKSEE